MFKKWWNSFCYSLGFSTLLTLLVSLIASNTNIRVMYVGVCAILPVHVFTFFTFELRLFSKHLWVRRVITICFSVIDVIIVLVLFDHTRLNSKRFWILLAILLPIMVLYSVFAYYVADKIEKRNLDAINRELANRNTSANNK